MKFRILSLFVFLTIACQEKSTNSSSASSDPLAESLESAVNAVAGASDDAANESVVASQTSPLMDLLIPSAHAAACSRNLSGAAGVCTRNVNCEAGPYVWSGTATLTFANGASCSFSGVGDTFLREVNFRRTGPRGNLLTTSAFRTNYLGQNIGGGIEVEKTGTGYELDILGQSKVLTSKRNSTVFDVSAETPVKLVMNKLIRSGRIVSSGTLNIYHNKAGFTAAHTFNNLEWNSTCCYPVSGSLDVSLSGSRTESGTVTFTGCGSVTTTFATTRSITLANCE
jgi:hypothetical protein